ncbi:MAG: ABC-type transport auxiliary lipoprotein family protein [Kiloniellales bacterium]|nr:ABC-type transport auxiliary lipoprotein family protein [Kiloniellales bacterium]
MRIGWSFSKYLLQRSAAAKMILPLCVLMLQACGSPQPETEVFSLRPSYFEPDEETEGLTITLQVRPLSAPAIYGDQRMVWRSSRESRALQSMDQRLWSESPSRLLQGEIIRCLTSSGAFERVVPADVQVDYDFALSGEVRDLVLEIDDGNYEAVIALDLFATQRRPRRLVWSGSYREAKSVGGQRAQDFVTAVESGLEDLCAVITHDLKLALSG